MTVTTPTDWLYQETTGTYERFVWLIIWHKSLTGSRISSDRSPRRKLPMALYYISLIRNVPFPLSIVD